MIDPWGAATTNNVAVWYTGRERNMPIHAVYGMYSGIREA